MPGGKGPLFRYIFIKSWKHVVCFVIVSLVLTFVPIIISLFDHTFINFKLDVDAAHDIGYYNQFALLLPFIIVFAKYYLNGLEPALLDLKKRNIVKISDKQYAVFCDQANRVFSDKYVTYTPFVVALVIYFFALKVYWFAGHNHWNSPSNGFCLNLSAWFSTIPTLLLYYFLTGFVIRIASVYKIIKLYLSFNVTIQPLHPDKAGGLSPLGEFSLRISLAGVFTGIICMIGVFSNYYQYNKNFLYAPNVVMILSYIIALSIVFFVPLFAARKGMKSAKEKTLLMISDKFNVAMSETMKKFNSHSNIENFNLDKIEDLEKLYTIASRMPVYPFNCINIVKFSSSVIWPLMTIIIKWLIDKL